MSKHSLPVTALKLLMLILIFQHLESRTPKTPDRKDTGPTQGNPIWFPQLAVVNFCVQARKTLELLQGILCSKLQLILNHAHSLTTWNSLGSAPLASPLTRPSSTQHCTDTLATDLLRKTLVFLIPSSHKVLQIIRNISNSSFNYPCPLYSQCHYFSSGPCLTLPGLFHNFLTSVAASNLMSL